MVNNGAVKHDHLPLPKPDSRQWFAVFPSYLQTVPTVFESSLAADSLVCADQAATSEQNG